MRRCDRPRAQNGVLAAFCAVSILVRCFRKIKTSSYDFSRMLRLGQVGNARQNKDTTAAALFDLLLGNVLGYQYRYIFLPYSRRQTHTHPSLTTLACRTGRCVKSCFFLFSVPVDVFVSDFQGRAEVCEWRGVWLEIFETAVILKIGNSRL